MKSQIQFISLLSLVFSVSAFAIPNPASVFCVKQAKGTIEIVDGQNGQNGICKFADGGIISEWTLYRAAKLQKRQTAVEKFKISSGAVPRVMPRPGHGVPSPSKIICQRMDGVYVSYARAGGDTVKLCEFSDGSSIGASTLMYGPKKETGKTLMSVLKMKFPDADAE